MPIPFWSVVTGQILLPLESDCYTFSGATGDRIFIRVVETSGLANLFTAQTMVLRPNGTTVCAAQIFRESLCQLDTTGTHELVIRDDAGTGVGTSPVFRT